MSQLFDMPAAQDEKRAVLAYAGCPEVEGRGRLHVFLKVTSPPRDGRYSAPQWNARNALYFESAPRTVRVGDVIECAQVGQGYELDSHRYLDTVCRSVRDEWAARSRSTQSAPDPLEGAVQALRAYYFGLPERERSKFTKALVERITRP